MKRLFLSVALIAGLTSVKAQKVSLLPKAGINIATQNVKGANNEKAKVGFQGGIGLNIPAGKSGFSVQPELNFVSKGVAWKAGNVKTTYNLNYLELPVLAKYTIGPVYLNAGPSIGLLLNKNNNAEATYGKLKKVDFGVQMGAGLAIPAGSGKFIIDGRYALGLSNISDVRGGNVKNRGVMASIGYAIPL